jgi:hypothetical protein
MDLSITISLYPDQLIMVFLASSNGIHVVGRGPFCCWCRRKKATTKMSFFYKDIDPDAKQIQGAPKKKKIESDVYLADGH